MGQDNRNQQQPPNQKPQAGQAGRDSDSSTSTSQRDQQQQQQRSGNTDQNRQTYSGKKDM